MAIIKRPMESKPPDHNGIKFPVLATPKLDGIRCLRIDGKSVSRRFIEIPNQHVRDTMNGLIDGVDGELVIDGLTFNQIQSAVMSRDGKPDFKFYVFDYVSVSLTEPYDERMEKLAALTLPDYCIKVLPKLINNEEELLEYEEKCLEDGYEGIMLRAPKGPYKCGRSTAREGYLLKLKRFADSEAVIIGFEELMSNQNEAETDEFGNIKRSKSLEGLVPAGTLGKFIVREIGNTPWKGEKFSVGVLKGFTAADRLHIWNNRDKYIGKILTYTYQDHGIKDLPRIPTGKGIRSPIDLSEEVEVP